MTGRCCIGGPGGWVRGIPKFGESSVRMAQRCSLGGDHGSHWLSCLDVPRLELPADSFAGRQEPAGPVSPPAIRVGSSATQTEGRHLRETGLLGRARVARRIFSCRLLDGYDPSVLSSAAAARLGSAAAASDGEEEGS